MCQFPGVHGSAPLWWSINLAGSLGFGWDSTRRIAATNNSTLNWTVLKGLQFTISEVCTGQPEDKFQVL